MYNPRSTKPRVKLNSPFPFASYVKSYSTQTPDSLKGLKINSHKINSDNQSSLQIQQKQKQKIQKLQRKNNKSQSSHKIIKKNNSSTKALEQIYSLIYMNGGNNPNNPNSNINSYSGNISNNNIVLNINQINANNHSTINQNLNNNLTNLIVKQKRSSIQKQFKQKIQKIQKIQKNQRINCVNINNQVYKNSMNGNKNQGSVTAKNSSTSNNIKNIYKLNGQTPTSDKNNYSYAIQKNNLNSNTINQIYQNQYGLLANAQEYLYLDNSKDQMILDGDNFIQSAMNSLSLTSGANINIHINNLNRKNLYRTRDHKNKSNSPTKKISKVMLPQVISSFRNALISLYSMLNRKQDYYCVLKNKPIQSLYPPLKISQIQQVFRKYIQSKGRDKGRTKFNYLTSQQMRSIKYKTAPNNNYKQSIKKQKKQKNNDDQQYSQDQVADGQQKPQLIDYPTWKRKNGIGQNQKVFIVKGGYSQLRKGLIDKGWYQNQDVWSPYFDFKWTTKICDIDYMNLRPYQSVNHFNNNLHLTSKYGITRRLKTLYLSHQIDIDKFYPRCYDLADLVDFQNFIQNFKFGFAQTIVKRFLIDKKRYQKLQLKVRTAYQIIKRRNLNFRLLVYQINKGNFHFITPEQWQILTQIVDINAQNMIDLLKSLKKKQSNQIPIQIQILFQSSKSISQEQKKTLNIQQLSERLIYERLHEKIQIQLNKIQKSQPQFQMNGYRNVWIAKPNFLSRGRGIKCYNNLYDIVTYCCGGTGQFVVQKYIENPLLIAGKKFDIRQWVLIQDYNPPKIWFYDQCYIRFCADDYSLDNIQNRFQHLTNNSIQKYNKNLILDKSMWEKSQFIQFIGKDKWQEILQKIQNIVVWTIKSCQGFVNGRKSSNQLVGYDFMIDQNLNPWLIQINMSPSMEYSTPVTKKLVKMVLQDTAKVMASNKKSNQIGLFKCIYKGNEDIQKFQKYKIGLNSPRKPAKHQKQKNQQKQEKQQIN